LLFEKNRSEKSMMVGTTDELRERAAFIRAAIERNAEVSASTRTGKTSEFWQTVFQDRPNFPDLNEVMTFRRSGFGYGIGDDRLGDIEREKRVDAQRYHIFESMVPKEFVASLPEAIFGAPMLFEMHGLTRSVSFFINAYTTYRVLEMVRRHGKRGPLRIAEIGPGWGACVHQLHSAAEVDSYLMIDLPENLYLSTLYLSAALPQRKLQFVDVEGDSISHIETGSIAACLPGAVSRIDAKFDLVLNSFSLQEMALDSVKAYIEWVDNHLSDDGIFVSLNSHGKAGVRQPSDYGYDRFHLYEFGVFRTKPQGYFNTIPYEAVLGRRKGRSPDYPSTFLNALGCLMQLGLDEDLVPLSRGLITGNLTDQDAALLLIFDRVFSAGAPKDKAALLREAEALDRSAIAPFVAAQVALIGNDNAACRSKLEESITRGLSGFARLRADVLLAAMQKRGPKTLPVCDGFDATFAYPEVGSALATGNLSSIIDHIRRVIMAPKVR
jgi:putative sugar O-methyltransferase